MSAKQLKLVIAIPVFNDWEAANLLLQKIDSVCVESGLSPFILLINDGSTMPVPDDFLAWRSMASLRVDVLELHKNLGHQRAICVALVHLCKNDPEAAVLIMDADGQDPPDQIPRLVEACLSRGQQQGVFAARRRRMEGLTFKLFYQLYRLVHLLLVGSDIHMGNFSLLPPALVQRLVRSNDLWCHYAAAAIKSRLPITTIPVDRAGRLSGRSQMSFVKLVLHGLSAMSVNSDIIGVRVLVFNCLLAGLGLIALASVLILRFSKSGAAVGIATNAVGLALVLVLQIVAVCVLFTFGVLALRGGQTFIPVRDCHYFISGIRHLEFKPAGEMGKRFTGAIES
jgi:glycosyltransferase involved in cell wall biosynthesis